MAPSFAAPSFKFQVSNFKRFTLADLAPEIADAVVSRWHVKPGDTVAVDDDLLEVVTDKAAITIPASVAGRIGHIAAHPGQPVRAEDMLFTLVQETAQW